MEFRMQTNEFFERWRDSYNTYLFELYNILINRSNQYKALYIQKINYDIFCVFVYRHSSSSVDRYSIQKYI